MVLRHGPATWGELPDWYFGSCRVFIIHAPASPLSPFVGIKTAPTNKRLVRIESFGRELRHDEQDDDDDGDVRQGDPLCGCHSSSPFGSLRLFMVIMRP